MISVKVNHRCPKYRAIKKICKGAVGAFRMLRGAGGTFHTLRLPAQAGVFCPKKLSSPRTSIVPFLREGESLPPREALIYSIENKSALL
jgi:hypothetical protein